MFASASLNPIFCIFILITALRLILTCRMLIIVVILIGSLLLLIQALFRVLRLLKVFLMFLSAWILFVICVILTYLLVAVMFLNVVIGFLPALTIVFALLILTILYRHYIFLNWRFYMELNIYTIFNHIDDDSDQLILGASDKRVAHDYYYNWLSRSRELEAKHMPPMDPTDYTIYRLGTYDTRTCEIRFDADRTVVEWYNSEIKCE